MPSSTVRRFTDPDDYMTMARGAIAELTVTGRGDFAAKSARIDLPRLWVARYTDNLRRIVHVVRMPGRANIQFRSQPGPSVLMSGVVMESTNLLRTSEDHDAHQLSAGLASHNTLSLSVEDMASVATTMAGCDLSPPRDTVGVTPPPQAMARLQRLQAAAMRLAEEAPEIIANPDAAHGLEQELIWAMVDCLGKGEVDEDRVARRQHNLIMRRFSRVLDEKMDQSLYITEICKLIGVSERTLEMCCREKLGVGPKRFLLLRRLHLARRALRKAAPDAATVTDIATRYGFWHFGRFAGEYRSLFGEPPSVTLHRQS